MPPWSADPDTIALIRRHAEQVNFTVVSTQARSDMMAHDLKRGDVADAIMEWIDAGERVKPTTIHSIPGREGDPAYEMKPRLCGMRWYIKVSIDDRGGLALLSAHVDQS